MPPTDPRAARWAAVQRLVDGALDLPPAARAAYLRAAHVDEGVRAEAERLLRACERVGESDALFARPAVDLAAPLLTDLQPAGTSEADRDAAIRSAVRDASAGRYVIERELARGGMATVYLARDLRHERDVAIKVIADSLGPEGVQRFLLEVRTAARLTHPHILGVHDSGERDGFLYYVMPFLGAETLRDRLQRGPLRLDDALQLMREIAEALACAHAHGIVHRDLKPENVLISGGHAIVSDFGIAKALAAAAEPHQEARAVPHAQGITHAGAILGTPAYMAPEQAVSDGDVDARTDLYALGIIAWEMLAGAHPFGARGGVAMLQAHRDESPAPIATCRSDVPRELGALLVQLTAREKSKRPAGAEDVLRRLRQIRVGSPGRGRKAVAAAVATVLLAASGFLALERSGVAAPPHVVETVAAGAAGAAGAAARLPLEVRSMAVLPFANSTGRSSDDYFSDGLTDELSAALATLPGLRLAGRTSSFSFRGSSASVQEIGGLLGVEAVVTGSVRRARDRVRVAVQLVGVADGRLLWSRVYESRSSDVFAVQDELTQAIISALRPSLGDGSGDGSGDGAALVDTRTTRGTHSMEAYDLYLRGRYHWLERGEHSIRLSIEYYRRALAADPGFARAQAGLALAYNALPVYVPLPLDSVITLVTVSAQRAMALDSTLADSRIAMAAALEREFRFAEAERHHRAALALEPANVSAHHFYGFMLAGTGRTDEAVAELRRAAQLDPLAKSAGAAHGFALAFARRYDESADAARRVLALDSTFMLGLQMLGLALTFGGAADSAVAVLEKGRRLHPHAPGMAVQLLQAYASAGRWSDAERIRAELRAAASDERGRIDAAVADMIFGDVEPLLALILTRRGLVAWYESYTFGCNPTMAPLWRDARYRAAMRQLGVTDCSDAGRG